MRRLAFPLALSAAFLLASCVDESTSPVDPIEEAPIDLLTPSLSILDGNNGDGNEHFFWLKPIGKSVKSGKSNKFTGEADPNLFPTVVVCERVDQGGGVFDCDDAEPALATFERGSEPSASGKSKKSRKSGKSGKSAKGEIKVDNKDHYFVQWSLKDHAPERDGQYRIKVLLGGSEIGHADVIVLRKSEKKAYRVDAGDVLIPISDKGNFKIAFRLEVGVLESQFCDFDGDGDVDDCDAAQEVAGDGKDTQIQVTDEEGGDEVVAVITAPDGVFTDVDGAPIPNVVVTAEVEIAPPSDDVFPDNQELPYFVEVNTYPDNVFIDPNGPGVDVLICQDEAVLTARGIVEPLHPQLILYKVGDNGVTRRLISTPAACAAPSPAPAQGFASLILRGVDGLRGLVGAQSLVARRRLHGGLNTKITRGKSLDDAAFSTFGAVLGPNADSTDAILPANGNVGVVVPITIQVQNALGENFLLGGDTLDVTVFHGPNAGAAVTVVDEGAGLYSASYTPTTSGLDSISIVLIRNDGVGLGPIGGSAFALPIDGPLANMVAVGSGYHHSCALRDDGKAYCWGRNTVGQLGDGTNVQSSFPVPVSGGHTFAKLFVGNIFSCGILADGSAYCWGSNVQGQLGAGITDASSNVPVAMAGGHTFLQMGLGLFGGCGVASDGLTYCWGQGSRGQLGNGTLGLSNVPVPVTDSDVLGFVEVHNAFHYNCALNGTGKLYCWGRDPGDFGNGTSSPTPFSTPVAAAGGQAFGAYANSYLSACALTSTGSAWCWGTRNHSGELGDGTFNPVATPTPILGGLTFKAIVSNDTNRSWKIFCGITPGDEAWCWGNNQYGQAGVSGGVACGSTINPRQCLTAPAAVSGGLRFASVDLGGDHTCGLTLDGGVYCWGDNTFGQLGDGTLLGRWAPAPVRRGTGLFSVSVAPSMIAAFNRVNEADSRPVDAPIRHD